jgi:outer membrane protein assembly factor BamB
LLGAMIAQFAATAAAQDWPQFRGENRDGVSPEKGLLANWPEAGPKEVWRRTIGEGYSAISVVGDRLYTMYSGEHEGTPVEFAAAFDAASGEELWRSPLGEKYDTEFGNGPRATPTVDGDTVYVLDSHGRFVALKTKDGSERWGVSLQGDFGAKQPGWGFSSSALVDGDQVVLEAGGPEGKSYVALDKKTGEVKWTYGDGGPGYNSAIVVEISGKKGYVYVIGDKLNCVDENGAALWSHPWPRGETHASPLFVAPDKIFASGAEGVGGALIRVAKKDGETQVEEVWTTRFMRNHFSSSIVHDGHIFGFDNATLKSISVDDASLAWAKRGLGKGSLIYADGKLFVLSDRGQLLMVEATPEGYVERGSVQALEGRSWTAPTLSNGRLYLRNHTEMVVYDLKG